MVEEIGNGYAELKMKGLFGDGIDDFDDGVWKEQPAARGAKNPDFSLKMPPCLLLKTPVRKMHIFHTDYSQGLDLTRIFFCGVLPSASPRCPLGEAQ